MLRILCSPKYVRGVEYIDTTGCMISRIAFQLNQVTFPSFGQPQPSKVIYDIVNVGKVIWPSPHTGSHKATVKAKC